MGLATVRMIVEAHQGTIQVSSRPGKGARFEIDFLAIHAGTG
jgi:signal transduction histidine kinase